MEISGVAWGPCTFVLRADRRCDSGDIQTLRHRIHANMNNVYGTIELDRLRCLEQRAALDDVACVVNRSRAPCPPVLIG